MLFRSNEIELTDAEVAELEKARKAAEADQKAAEAAAKAKADARLAIADKLGLTEADLNVLFSA